MTEHDAVIFFFFLAEYASIVLICILTTILFLGGYLYYNIVLSMLAIVQYINFNYYLEYIVNKEILTMNPLIEGFLYGISLGLKSCIMIFILYELEALFLELVLI